MMAMYYSGYDFNYLIYVIVPLLFSLWAQWMVSSNFKKYSQQKTANRVTGQEVAGRILRANSLEKVKVVKVNGELTDHYDPRKQIIALSESVYGNDSVAAVGVAAHEVGHALQYAHGYWPIKIRMAIIPVTQFGSKLAVPLVLLGLLLGFAGLVDLGIILFALVVVFQLITLPVEFDASKRAIQNLQKNGLLKEAEVPATKKVLSAAAMTYVAGLTVAIGQLLQLLSISGRGRKRD